MASDAGEGVGEFWVLVRHAGVHRDSPSRKRHR